MLNAIDLNSFRSITPFRDQRLFQEFLPKGYRITSIDSLENIDEVIQLKVILGAIITLYDDFADRPGHQNSKLLRVLYKLPFEPIESHSSLFNKVESDSINLAISLFEKLLGGLRKLPNYNRLKELFFYDLSQFYNANYYSELLGKYHFIGNPLENRIYLHHNMGMVMAGMIDLMSLSRLNIEEVGPARNIFLLGQRAGRISNVLSTYEREIAEGDLTNELLSLCKGKNLQDKILLLEKEHGEIIKEIKSFSHIKSFSAKRYSQGIEQLHRLHIDSKEVI